MDAERGDQQALEEIDGYPLRLASDPEFSLRLESLDRRRDGVELLSVKSEAGVQVANVFVRKDKLVAFVRLIEKYRDEATDAGKPKNQKLVDSIAVIRQVAVRDLWQDSAEFPGLNQPIWWEVWIRATTQPAEEAYGAFATLARERELRVGDHFVAFPERVVLLVWATARQLGESVDLLSYIAELRRAKEIPTEYLELPPRDQRAFVEDVLQRLAGPSPNAPAVCLLDTGVNRQHPLIAPVLAPADAQAVDPAWGTADHDHDQHGTGMAGVAVYRCLTDVFNSAGPVTLRHCLESVKLLPPPPMANDPDVYGWVTQQAVARAEIQAPERNRAICMAITTDDRDQGLPSSWSAAVDQMCVSDPDLDQDARLMFISAGNYAAVLTNPGYAYPDWNHQYAGVQDPAQSWNSVTVGAFTDLVSIHDPTFRGWQPIAPAGDLTPSSRTSLAWPEENYDWPIKPDIVMEGGNYVTDGMAAPDPELAPTASPTQPVHPQTRIGHVHLKVADLERAIGFYHGVLGFEVVQRMGRQAAFLSAGGYHHHIGLNTWESKGGSPPPSGTTGLYHVAILFPTRAALADALRRLIAAGIELDGAADHGVSEALYLHDPDGNGVELYWDRPKEQWPHDAAGELAMYTHPLDLEALLAEHEGGERP